MKRFKIAVLLLVVIATITCFGQFSITHITETMCKKLENVKHIAKKEEFNLANQELDEALQYFEDQKFILEFFLKKDNIADLDINLSGLNAYLNAEYLCDFHNEVDKAMKQTQMLNRLFFSFF